MRRNRENIFQKWDKALIYSAVICICLLLVSQVLLIAETPRRFLSRVDRLEGEPISRPLPFYAEKPLSITEAPAVNKVRWFRENRPLRLILISPKPNASILATVNGQPIGDFVHGELLLTVYEGDYVEILTGAIAGAKFVVHSPDGGIVSPTDGTVVEAQDGVAAVGKVKFVH